jgi:hypothetical protein
VTSEKPLIALTATEKSDAILTSGLGKPDYDDFQRTWVNDLRVRLARLSTRGKRIVLPDSGHDIPSDRPDSIVNAVQEVRAQAVRAH